jgi:hypothetical protein
MKCKISDDAEVGMAYQQTLHDYLCSHESESAGRIYQQSKEFLTMHIRRNRKCLPYLQNLFDLLRQDDIIELFKILVRVLNSRYSHLNHEAFVGVLDRSKYGLRVLNQKKLST